MTKEDNQITQEQVNNAVWAACDTFRGVMDASNYKDVILIMLFIKYISDLWRDHYEEYKKKHGDNEKRIRQYMKLERFVLPEGASFYDLYEQRNKADIGNLINKALASIEDSNKEKLRDAFTVDFNSETKLGQPKDKNRRLKNLLEDFHKPELDLRPSRVSGDIIGNAYIYLIERFDSEAGKKAGEFYTPRQVSRLVARLCRPKAGARICDPACGSGSLLLEAGKVAEKEGKKADYSLYGMESNVDTWTMCRLNMFLHDIDSATIEWCDSLNDPALADKEKGQLTKFDNIVANPPFSLKKWGAENAENDPYGRYDRGIPPKGKGDYAFISHMIASAKNKKGRVAVVVPHGALFRGAAEGRIRKALIEENLLDAVIGLPANLFPTTSIPVSILVFDRSREKGGENHKRKDVLFIDASREYEQGKNQNRLLDEHLDKILKTYKQRRSVDKYAYLAKFKEIEENDFNLNIPRYVDTFEEEEEIDIDAVQEEIDQLEGELAKVRKEMAKVLREIKR